MPQGIESSNDEQDELDELRRKNLTEGMAAVRQSPDALRQQAEAMMPPEEP